MSPESPRKTSHRAQFWMVLAAFVVVAAGGSVVMLSLGDWNAPAKAKNMPNPVASTAANVNMGMSIYREKCAKCHGDSGDGKGEKAGELSVAPTDFTSGAQMKGATDGELFWKISQGHRPMPAYKTKLSEEERWKLVDYIRTFAKAPQIAAPLKTQ